MSGCGNSLRCNKAIHINPAGLTPSFTSSSGISLQEWGFGIMGQILQLAETTLLDCYFSGLGHAS